jgi:hypothetical protein
MKKEELAKTASEVREGWDETIGELTPEGLERPGATGEWRVRDVLAHFNGWDRWQLVQLRCAFTGERPTDEELTGGITYPDNDDMSEDAMNAMFIAGTRDLPLEEIVAGWREVSDMRRDWIAAASQDQLDTMIGADWASGTHRIFRLVSEVPTVSNPEHVWERLLDQIEHQRMHLQIVRDWMRAEPDAPG